MSNSKKMVIFDFDLTIVNKSSFFELYKQIESKEVMDKIKSYYKIQDFQALNKLVFDHMKENGYSVKQILDLIHKSQISEGMINLFEYFKSHQSEYDLYVISSNMVSIIEDYLEFYNYRNLFTKVIGYRDKIDAVNDCYEFYSYLPKGECKLCGNGLCKTNELQYFLNHIDSDCNGKGNAIYDYDRKIFICDGTNDFCLAKSLSKIDKVFIRKGHGLEKKLINENLFGQLKCEISYWNNGDDIINLLSIH